jgi:hypothetical protein
MLNTRTGGMMVGAGAAMTLLVALAVVVGLIPHGDGTTGGASQLAAASVTPAPAPVAEAAPAPDPEPAPAPEPVATEAPVRHSSPTTAASAGDSGDDSSSSGPAAAAGPASTRAARTTPTGAQVQAAIQGFHARIPAYTPTSAQVADFGNQVCSAFDSGESYSQVKAAGLAQVAGNPFVTVTSADADWMIRTAVSMYCPGYASKLP